MPWRRFACGLGNTRGTVVLWVAGSLFSMLICFGFAVDVAYLAATRAAIHRSMDAAALAGAGKLGFNNTVFPTVRSFAQTYATANPFHAISGAGTITLNANTGNSPSGHIVLGIWNGATRTFTPSLDGSFVNAVRCQYSTTIPTSFLSLVGIMTLPVSAMSTAVANPPSILPPGTCLFPFGLSHCPFSTPGGLGTQGCGAVVSFINANTNTAGWIRTAGADLTQTPSASVTRNAVAAAAGGGGACANNLTAGTTVGTQGGMDQSVFDDISRCNPGNGLNCNGYFNTNYAASPNILVTDADGNERYNGPGWEVYVPIIQSDNCPPGNINQPHRILTFTRFVIAQVINHGWCGVANHYSRAGWVNPWDALCPPPNGTAAARDSNLRAIYGFYECSVFQGVPPTIEPAPTSALATQLRIVE